MCVVILWAWKLHGFVEEFSFAGANDSTRTLLLTCSIWTVVWWPWNGHHAIVIWVSCAVSYFRSGMVLGSKVYWLWKIVSSNSRNRQACVSPTGGKRQLHHGHSFGVFTNDLWADVIILWSRIIATLRVIKTGALSPSCSYFDANLRDETWAFLP